MVSAVTDPALIQQLEGGAAPPAPVTDPMLLKTLESGPQQMTGPLRYPAMIGSNVLGGLQSVGNMLPKVLPQNPMQGIKLPGDMTTPTQTSTIGQDVSALANRPELQPQGEGERLLAAGARGVGSMLPMGIAGPGVIGPRLIAQGLGGGISGQAGYDLYPKNWFGASAVPFLTSVLGAQGAGAIFDVGMRIANAFNSPAVKLDAYKTLGVEPRLRGDITGKPEDIYRQNVAISTPGGVQKGNEAIGQTLNEFNAGVSSAADQLGTSSTLQQLGQKVQSTARDWVENTLPQQESRAWAPVNAQLQNAQTPLANYQAALQQLTSQEGPLTATKQALLPSKARELIDALQKDFPGQAQTPIVPWQEAQKVRSLIGQAYGTPEIMQSIGERQLGQLYGALSEDMRSTANTVGAGPAFDMANQFSRQANAFKTNVIGKMISSSNPDMEMITPAQAAQNILNTLPSGDTTIASIRSRMPKLADEIASFKLRDMVLATPGRQNALGTAVSPQQFLTDWNNLAPEAQQALFSSNPEVAKKVAAATVVANDFKQTAALFNASRTTPTAAAHAAAEAPARALGGAVEGGAGGAVLGSYFGMPALGAIAGAPLGAIYKGVGPYTGGFLAAQRSFNPWYNRYLMSQPTQIPGAIKQLGNVAPSLLMEPQK